MSSRKEAEKPSLQVVLQNWSVCGEGPYVAPECQLQYLQGRVFGHPGERFADGDKIRTSRIVGVKGRVIECKHRKYVLGRIDPKYRRWLRENGFAYDPKVPITMKQQAGREEG